MTSTGRTSRMAGAKGKLAEAQSAIKEALRLGTRDAKLFYHAG